MTRVYIAASSREVGRVREAQALAATWGWELTLDWLTPVRRASAMGERDVDMPIGEQRDIARADLDAVERADLLWLLSPRQPTKGAWWEAGHAHALGIPVVVSGCTPETLPSIFTALVPSVDEDCQVRAWWSVVSSDRIQSPPGTRRTIGSPVEEDVDIEPPAPAMTDIELAGPRVGDPVWLVNAIGFVRLIHGEEATIEFRNPNDDREHVIDIVDLHRDPTCERRWESTEKRDIERANAPRGSVRALSCPRRRRNGS